MALKSAPAWLTLLFLLIWISPSRLPAQEKSAQREPDPRHETDNVIRFYQWRVARDPDDYFNYDKLGSAYLRKGRETGDVSYYERAEQVLKKSLELESTHREAISATLHLGTVCFAEHRFHEALAYTRKALDFNTGDVSPRAVEGDVLLELGDYDGAASAYSKLDRSGPSTATNSALSYLRETRRSNLEHFRGNPEASVLHMRNAVRIAVDARMPAETIAWTQFSLGEEYFQTGDLENAGQATESALAVFPGYYRALAGLAKVRVAQDRLEEAIALYKQALAAVPVPTDAAALGDVYAKLGRTADARRQYDLVEFIAQLSALSKTVYNRELALFYADHDIRLSEAVTLAQKELEVRRDVYTWDTLAWAFYKDAETGEAVRAMERALSRGTKDALIFYHAGLIYERAGDTEKAKQFLRRALSTNPHFHIFYAESAAKILRQLEMPSGR
ncbi:MAG TPA: tetratricopeptide repeat protein [Bryobacteraceae bacterium]|nr:tetratricopeptide repeat protein [Bryobacteraceae bacterium]